MSWSGYVHADGERLFVQHLSNTEALPSRREWAKKLIGGWVSMEVSNNRVHPNLIGNKGLI